MYVPERLASHALSALVPLALIGTLALAPLSAYASEAAGAPADAATVPAVAAASESAGEAQAATLGGLAVELPASMQVSSSSTLLYASNAEGTLTALLEGIAGADLGDDLTDEALAEAFEAAANASASGYKTSSVEALGTRDLGNGAAAWVFELKVAGPYEVVEGEGGTTMAASALGDEDSWTVSQAYVKLADGSFALAQVAVSDAAGVDAVAAAEEIFESLAAGDDAAEAAYGFAFEAPEGLEGADGVWLGASDNIMVAHMGTLISADDAAAGIEVAREAAASDAADEGAATDEGEAWAGLTQASVEAVLANAADAMGGELEGVEAYEAKGCTVQVGVISLTSGTQAYECLVVLVPVSDGSIEGLMAVCDSTAAASWADRLVTLVESIELVDDSAEAAA